MTPQDRRDNQRRALSRRLTFNELFLLLQNKPGLKRLETDEFIKNSLLRKDTHLEGLTNVQRLVHLAMRKDVVDEDDLKTALTKQRRRAYEDEISIQLERLGCKKSGRLSGGPALSELSDLSRVDAQSIVSTYNDDLAKEIARIGAANPRANRNTYAKALKVWDEGRATSKGKQIAQYTDSTARRVANKDFFALNDVAGVATIAPSTAKCPVCAGWIARGELPLQEIVANSPPYHPNCNHYLVVLPSKKVSLQGCEELWSGE